MHKWIEMSFSYHEMNNTFCFKFWSDNDIFYIYVWCGGIKGTNIIVKFVSICSGELLKKNTHKNKT